MRRHCGGTRIGREPWSTTADSNIAPPLEDLGDPHAEVFAELRETLEAWQRGKEEIDESIAANQPNSSRRRRQLYRAQRSLLDSLSPEARELFVDAKVATIGGICFQCTDDDDGDSLMVDSYPVLVL